MDITLTFFVAAYFFINLQSEIAQDKEKTPGAFRLKNSAYTSLLNQESSPEKPNLTVQDGTEDPDKTEGDEVAQR